MLKLHNLKVGQRLTIISISSMMATTTRQQVTIKTLLPIPKEIPRYSNGPIEHIRYGTMVLAGKRKQYHLDVRAESFVFDGWEKPFLIDSESPTENWGGMTVTKYSGNACFNFVGDPDLIRRHMEELDLNGPATDEMKAKILIGEVPLYPEIETGHAVVNRHKAALAAA